MNISPTPGRVLWFFGTPGIDGFARPGPGQPCAAIVTRVWSDVMVNLAVFDANGKSYPMTSVKLLQEGDSVPEYGSYATWMPYQVGQAKKHATEDKSASVFGAGAGNAEAIAAEAKCKEVDGWNAQGSA